MKGLTAAFALGSSGLKVFGDGMSPDGIASILGNVGVVGALIWFMWYTQSVAQPKMLAQFASEQAALRASSAAEQAALRSAFAAEQAALRDAFAAEQDKLRAHTDREKAELRAMLADALRSMRAAVHDVKNTAQAAISKADAAQVAREQQGGNSG